MKAVRMAANLALWALLVGCAAFFVAVGVGPRTGRYATMTVLSGSMRPTIPEGAMVVITPLRPEEVEVGQVLTFAVPDGDRQVVSHRVIEVVRSGDRPVIRTQGDANDAPDPWVAEIDGGVAWRVRYAVPGAGNLINRLRQPVVSKVSIYVVPAVLALIWLVDIWRPAEPEAAGAAA